MGFNKLIIIILSFFVQFSLAFANENKTLILDKNRHASQVRVDMILKAEKSIKAQYYIYGNDTASLIGLALLAEAKQRGLKTVQLLVDAYSNEIPRPIIAYLISMGVEIREYHPLSIFNISHSLRRMHNKYFSIDGRKMIVGGRNVKNNYFGINALFNFIDRDLYVIGPVVEESDKEFDKLFNSSHVSPINVETTEWELNEAKKKLNKALSTAKTLQLFKFNKNNDWDNLASTVEKIDFSSDNPDDKNDPQGIVSQVYNAMYNAKDSILIETPYLVPTEQFLNLLKWLQKNRPQVKITIVTNSEHSMEIALAQGAYLRFRNLLLDLDIEIFEYKGPQALHGKTIVIDRMISFITSMNFDSLSETNNLENGVRVEDAVFAEKTANSIDKHILKSFVVTDSGLMSQSSRPVPNLSLFKKTILKLSYCASFFLRGRL